MKKKSFLSIIIINYKTCDLTINCIKSVIDKNESIDIEFIVVDNDSNDGIKEEIKKLNINFHFIQMGYNSGFSRANNAGLRIAKGDKILLLNSDTIFFNKGTLSKCITQLDSLPSKTILSCKLVNEDFSYQVSVRNEFYGIKYSLRANPIYIKFKLGKSAEKVKQEILEVHQKNGYVTWCNGAFLLFDKNLIQEDNLFWDEDFFLYGEDVEWTLRCSRKNYKFYFLSNEEIIHLGSASSSISIIKQMQVILSDYLFARKSYGRLYVLLWFTIDLFNVILDRSLLFLKKKRSRRPSKHSNSTMIINEIRLYLIKNYFFTLIFRNKFSTERSFFINCYKFDIQNAKKIQKKHQH